MNLREVRLTGFDGLGLALVGYGVPILVYTFPWFGIGVYTHGPISLFVVHTAGLIAGLVFIALGKRARRRVA